MEIDFIMVFTGKSSPLMALIQVSGIIVIYYQNHDSFRDDYVIAMITIITNNYSMVAIQYRI